MPSPLALPSSGGYHKADIYHSFSSKAPHLPYINGATKEFTTMTYRKYMRKINSIDVFLKNTLFIILKSHSNTNFESVSIARF